MINCMKPFGEDCPQRRAGRLNQPLLARLGDGREGIAIRLICWFGTCKRDGAGRMKIIGLNEVRLRRTVCRGRSRTSFDSKQVYQMS
jgi:hypothetical protein